MLPKGKLPERYIFNKLIWGQGEASRAWGRLIMAGYIDEDNEGE
jgi:hypothetical protein